MVLTSLPLWRLEIEISVFRAFEMRSRARSSPMFSYMAVLPATSANITTQLIVSRATQLYPSFIVDYASS